jgi:hypothetical protein
MTTSILSGSARRVLSGNAIRALLRTEMIRYSNVLTKGPLFLYPDSDVVEKLEEALVLEQRARNTIHSPQRNSLLRSAASLKREDSAMLVE